MNLTQLVTVRPHLHTFIFPQQNDLPLSLSSTILDARVGRIIDNLFQTCLSD